MTTRCTNYARCKQSRSCDSCAKCTRCCKCAASGDGQRGAVVRKLLPNRNARTRARDATHNQLQQEDGGTPKKWRVDVSEEHRPLRHELATFYDVAKAFGFDETRPSPGVLLDCIDRLKELIVPENRKPEEEKCMLLPTLAKLLESFGGARKTGSTEHRLILALVSKISSSREEFKAFTKLSSKDAYTSARDDYAKAARGEALVVARTVRRVDEEVVREALQFVASPACSTSVSWVTIDKKVNGVWVTFPGLCRMASRKALFERYIRYDSNHRKLGRSSFIHILNAITKGEVMMRQAVDYVLVDLIYDNQWRLKRLIEGECPSERVSDLLGSVRDVFTYAKDGFRTCLTKELVQFALGLEGVTSTTATEDIVGSSFSIFSVIKSLVPSQHHDIIDESAHKIRLYLGHIVRQRAQQIRLQDVVKNISSTQGHLILDYKMKVLPTFYREGQLQHYGKRGMSYHGSALRYTVDGKDIIMYIDIVVAGENQQDAVTTCAILEVTLEIVRRIAPGLKNVTIQSDNASNYACPLAKLMMRELDPNGIVDAWIHTEAQDGKSFLDGHFAIVNKQIEKYVLENQSAVATPTDIALAMAYEGGLGGTHLEVIRCSRTHLDELEERYDAVKKQVQHLLPPRIMEWNFRSSSVKEQSLMGTFELGNNTMTPIWLKKWVKSNPPSELNLAWFEHIPKSMKESTSQHDSARNELDDIPAREDDDEMSIQRDEAHPEHDDDDSDEEMVEIQSQAQGGDEPPSTIHFVCPATQTKVERQASMSRVQRALVSKKRRRESFNVDNVGETSAEAQEEDYERDVVSTALRIFTRVPSYTANRWASQLKPPRLAESATPTVAFPRGWARRPPHGKTYGATYMSQAVKDVCTELFRVGEEQSSAKFSPAQMHEEVMKRVIGYGIPSITEVQKFVGTMSSVKKQKAQSTKQAGGETTAVEKETGPAPSQPAPMPPPPPPPREA